jgi:EAL domain-containing protein (putative c-di-GMP-specific phosphodiesterase class I)
MLIQSAEVLAHLRKICHRDDLFMHVNVTARDLAQSSTVTLIEALMLGHDLPDKALRIELTEQAALRNRDEAVAAALAMKHFGAGLVLDDFGSGHSSFSWLAELPVDSLKIDPELTRRLGDPRTDTILQTVTLLAERLGMQSTAEGVENREDAARLRVLGFDFVQGYAFGRPMSAKALEMHVKGWA